MHKSTWLFQEYLISLSHKESHTTYLTRLQSHQDLTPQAVNLDRHNADTLRGFGDKQNWDGLAVSSCIYL